MSICIGVGVKQSDQDAFKWYRKAASHEIVKAQFNLALFYQQGKKDIVVAIPTQVITCYKLYI